MEPLTREQIAASDPAGAFDTTLACAQAPVRSVHPPPVRGGAAPPSRRWRWGTPALVCLVGTLLASGIATAVERRHRPAAEPTVAARVEPRAALPRAEPPELASELPLDTLLAAESDPSRAADPFHGRLVRTRGQVRRVETSALGDVYVMLDGTRVFSAGRLECVVPARGEHRALALSRGDQVEVVGRIVDAGLNVVARNCRVVGVEHPEQAIPLAAR